MNSKLFETIFENNLLTVEINKLAKQANGNVLVRYKDTVILNIAVLGKTDVVLPYFPLMVNYQEKLYAAGKIPGSFAKREGKPSDHEVLISRLIDRALRPLFPDNLKKEVQLVSTVLSSDPDCNNEIFSLLGCSLALLVSNIPFTEAVASVCVGCVKDRFVINPTLKEKEKSSFLLTLSGTKYSLNMIEAIANEISEQVLLEAMFLGHQKIKQLCLFQEQIKEELNLTKIQLYPTIYNEKLKKIMEDLYKSQIQQFLEDSYRNKTDNVVFNQNIKKLKSEILIYFQTTHFSNKESNLFLDLENDANSLVQIEKLFDHLISQFFRKMIIQEKKRVDGRKLDEIRSINTQINLLPRAHGSAIFTRGQTQSLAVVTLGTLNESKTIDDLSEEEKKRFILHYNFPSFATGEIGRYNAPSRREIGHGILAEKALHYMLPLKEDFPYTIRVVSEILESNGSSSQATICAASMALMDAGVPLKKAVAGIAMGLFYYEKKAIILSDIQGLEDKEGDMDLKVSGTEKGITALQMDIKIKEITFDILKEALSKARLGYMEILTKMNQTISTSKQQLSIYAPKVQVIHVKTDKIRDIIGAGGKIISQIIENHDNVKIDIQQDGKIFIIHHNPNIVQKTSEYILNLVQDIKVGNIYEVTVSRILKDKKGQSFGAILEVFSNIEGFIHISQLTNTRVEKVEDVLEIGDKIRVRCISINEKGKIDFSLK
ncbi:polyribonucleotide nucleotidyltransferase [Candidatus Phytoplasma phoenicium]|uniref:Polyribonucleotide nucleotidyltransferase n=1 Tax=Candidatus Phytoplasma phoenicium TaxID=198422 RepID=A0A0L0MKV1_9MOLU|nr:polyribonucleotide nucleotidyltransferase [Candidatus Phytoplasma phoenicium]KND62614.1 Polyribonucleotide nucleotidyltransferase [Candidatus Phytoplasma phoenicium]